MKLFYLIGLSFIIFSCGKSEQIREEISMEELLGEEIKEEIVDIEKAKIPELDGTITSVINQKVFETFLSDKQTNSTLFDRFENVSTEKTKFSLKNDTLLSADLFIYNYSDSTAVNNVFYNWLDCFGSQCQEVKRFENSNKIEENPLWCGVYDTTVIILKFNNLQKEDKGLIKQTVKNAIKQSPRYSFDIHQNKKLIWN